MAAHEAAGKSNEWYTPKYIFDALGERFDLDVACPAEGPRHVPADAWFAEASLSRQWYGFVWMNPPFGHQRHKRQWLAKFFTHGNGVALVPDRTSAPWFQEFGPQADAILWVSPKVKFERPDGTRGEWPGNGTALLAKGERGVAALCRATRLGFVTRPYDGEKMPAAFSLGVDVRINGGTVDRQPKHSQPARNHIVGMCAEKKAASSDISRHGPSLCDAHSGRCLTGTLAPAAPT